MKKYILGTLSLFILFLSGCVKDNYDEPESNLTGKIISNGEALGVSQRDGAVQLQLWQDGYDLYTAIPVYVAQDGTFSAKLFDGTYKLVTRDNNGPWVNDRDTVVVKVSGTTAVEYPVKPYYVLKGEEFKVANNVLTSTFNIQEVTAGKTIEKVTLYVNNTKFVDAATNVKNQDSALTTAGDYTITMDISDLTQPILHARIGVKISGIGEMLYTVGSKQIR